MDDVEEMQEAIDAEETWIAQAASGNLSAFDALVRRYRPSVAHAVTKVLGSRDSVEDVVQDTFLMAFRALPQLRDHSKFAGWLMAIAKHRAIRVSKRDATERPVEFSQLDRVLIQRSQALAPQGGSDRWDWVLAGFQTLPDEIRQVAELHYLQGWPVAKIGEALELTVTTVKWRLHRCRELLRRRMPTDTGENHAS